MNNQLLSIISLAILLSVVSCASLGTKINVVTPEAISSIREVAIWPIALFPLTNKLHEKFPELIDTMLAWDPVFEISSISLSKSAEEILLVELNRTKLFKIKSSKDVSRNISKKNSKYSRFDRVNWQDYKDVISADIVLISTIRFEREAGGANSYVTLTLYNRSTGAIVIESKFNTKWGKSYLGSQDVYTTLPDAIEGAVNGLANELRKYPAFGGTSTK